MQKKQKLAEDLSSMLDEEVDSMYYAWAKQLLETSKPSKILASILSYAFKDELDPGTYGRVKEFESKGRDLDQHGKARLFVALGKKDKLNPAKLSELIMRTIKINAREITDVQVMDNFSFITVPFEHAEPIIKAFKVKKKGQKPLVMHAKK
jgi:ATP-dependent RNA helicase DeaD